MAGASYTFLLPMSYASLRQDLPNSVTIRSCVEQDQTQIGKRLGNRHKMARSLDEPDSCLEKGDGE